MNAVVKNAGALVNSAENLFTGETTHNLLGFAKTNIRQMLGNVVPSPRLPAVSDLSSVSAGLSTTSIVTPALDAKLVTNQTLSGTQAVRVTTQAVTVAVEMTVRLTMTKASFQLQVGQFKVWSFLLSICFRTPAKRLTRFFG